MVRPPMSLLLWKHVALGGVELHPPLVNAGKVTVPTNPLGVVPPAQLLELDQLEVPTGAAPLQVKSACATACGGRASRPPAPQRKAERLITASPTRAYPVRPATVSENSVTPVSGAQDRFIGAGSGSGPGIGPALTRRRPRLCSRRNGTRTHLAARHCGAGGSGGRTIVGARRNERQH